MRMSKISVENCKVADRFKIQSAFDSNGYLVRAIRGECNAYLTSGEGFAIQYPTKNHAVRAIRRIRPDAPITEI